jgi:hypothetical protein
VSLRHYVVTLESLRIHEGQQPSHDKGHWSLYAYVNQDGRGSLLAGNDINGEPLVQATNERFLSVGENQTIHFHNVRFSVFLVPGQTLRVAFRASDWNRPPYFGSSYFMGTAERVYRGPDGTWANHDYVVASNYSLVVGQETSETYCNGSCFTVTYHIQRVP